MYDTARVKTVMRGITGLLLLGQLVVASPGISSAQTLTPGFFKNHPSAWPVPTITIGGVTYPQDHAIYYMGMPSRGDKTYDIYASLCAAKLNVLLGNDASCIASVIAAADAWLGSYYLGSGIAGSDPDWQEEGETLHQLLDAYNNGELCAPPAGD